MVVQVWLMVLSVVEVMSGLRYRLMNGDPLLWLRGGGELLEGSFAPVGMVGRAGGLRRSNRQEFELSICGCRFWGVELLDV